MGSKSISFGFYSRTSKENLNKGCRIEVKGIFEGLQYGKPSETD